jgi:hypothetical protein
MTRSQTYYNGTKDRPTSYGVDQETYTNYSRASGVNLIGGASYRAANNTPDEFEEEVDPTVLDAEEREYHWEVEIDTGQDEGFINLAGIGVVEAGQIFEALDEISEKYLTDIEGDLIDLMRKGRRPVEISRILKIPECEVVRLRRNCFRKIRVVFTYDYFNNKERFVNFTIDFLKLNEKQSRILKMFFDYYGLRPIAEVIGTRPSNIHRSLESIKAKLLERLKPDHEYYSFLSAFRDLKYLNLRISGGSR